MPPTVTKQKPQGNKKTGSVLDRIKPMGFDPSDGLKVLLYGKSKTGKTTFWSTFPGPILAVICSGSKRAGELRSIDTPENRKKIRTITITNTEELKEVVEKAAPDFATVVLDHVSGLQDLTLKQLLNLDEIPEQKSFGFASMDDYNASTSMCKEYVRAMLNVKGNTIIVGQERVFNPQDDGVISEVVSPTIGVAVTPSLAGWLNPAVDYILQTFKAPKYEKKTVKKPGGKVVTKIVKGKGVEFCMRIAPHEVFITGFRAPKENVLPDYITDPTYDKIIKLIKGE